MTLPTPPEMMTIDQTVAFLRGVPSKKSLYRWNNTRRPGELVPSRRIGKRLLYDLADVLAWLEQQRQAELARGRRPA